MNMCVLFVSLLLQIVDGQFAQSNQVFFLTSDSNKSWILHSSVSQCTQSDYDNTYTFSSNGTFTFDHGTILEDPNCTSDDCCTDLVNITGKWKFTSNQTRLVITALTETGNPSNVLNVVLFDAVIDQLDENVLIFTQTHPTTGEKRTFEFHKK